MKNNILVDVSNKKIIEADAINFVQDDSFGAEVSFKGIVRDINHGKKVVQVSYDAFEPLAKKTLYEIALEGINKFQTNFKIAIFHRTGDLKVRDLSLLVVVGSKHRDEAYELSRYIVEELKVRVPIWKKEYYETGETAWLRGHVLCAHPPKNLENRVLNERKHNGHCSSGGEIHSHGNG